MTTRNLRPDPDQPMNPVLEYGQMPTFADFIAEHSKGKALEEITDLFARLLLAVRQTEKGGQLTIKVKVNPISGALANFAVEADARMPKADPPIDVLYVDPAGLPARQDPAQMRLDFTDLTTRRPAADTTDLT